MFPRSGLVLLLTLLAAGCGGPRAGKLDGESQPPAGEAQPPAGEGQVCTRDAKVCPDGSTVGRTGPNCEFAPCAAAEPPAGE